MEINEFMCILKKLKLSKLSRIFKIRELNLYLNIHLVKIMENTETMERINLEKYLALYNLEK